VICSLVLALLIDLLYTHSIVRTAVYIHAWAYVVIVVMILVANCNTVCAQCAACYYKFLYVGYSSAYILKTHGDFYGKCIAKYRINMPAFGLNVEVYFFKRLHLSNHLHIKALASNDSNRKVLQINSKNPCSQMSQAWDDVREKWGLVDVSEQSVVLSLECDDKKCHYGGSQTMWIHLRWSARWSTSSARCPSSRAADASSSMSDGQP